MTCVCVKKGGSDVQENSSHAYKECSCLTICVCVYRESCVCVCVGTNSGDKRELCGFNVE